MSKSKQKYYVVWVGATPGIYPDWEGCKAQINAFPDAKFKAFDTLTEAETAFSQSHHTYYKQKGAAGKSIKKNSSDPRIIRESLAVDAACSGNPGIMEYRGVDIATGKVVFHQGPFKHATNNIGEFLAIVHALAFLQKAGINKYTIYSDSKTAISWVKNRKALTKLSRIPGNEPVFDLIDRAENWLKDNTWDHRIVKWETEIWGEIPADFGRK